MNLFLPVKHGSSALLVQLSETAESIFLLRMMEYAYIYPHTTDFCMHPHTTDILSTFSFLTASLPLPVLITTSFYQQSEPPRSAVILLPIPHFINMVL